MTRKNKAPATNTRLPKMGADSLSIGICSKTHLQFSADVSQSAFFLTSSSAALTSFSCGRTFPESPYYLKRRTLCKIKSLVIQLTFISGANSAIILTMLFVGWTDHSLSESLMQHFCHSITLHNTGLA